MFEKRKREQMIKFLEEYLRINNFPYEESNIKERFDKFDEYYNPLRSKCMAGVPGYEKYTDSYIFMKRVELLTQLFGEYSSFGDWAKALKFNLITSDKRVVRDSGLTVGQDKDALTPTEILLNETTAKNNLSSIKLHIQTEDIYKKK